MHLRELVAFLQLKAQQLAHGFQVRWDCSELTLGAPALISLQENILTRKALPSRNQLPKPVLSPSGEEGSSQRWALLREHVSAQHTEHHQGEGAGRGHSQPEIRGWQQFLTLLCHFQSSLSHAAGHWEPFPLQGCFWVDDVWSKEWVLNEVQLTQWLLVNMGVTSVTPWLVCKDICQGNDADFPTFH